MRIGFAVITLGFTLLQATAFGRAQAQDARLARLPDATTRVQVNAILEDARATGLPAEPLVDRALEAVAKGAPPQLIVSATTRLRDELRVARAAFGVTANPAELIAGASALRAGATRDDLARLHALRPGYNMTIAAAVLADMVAAGVPADTGIAAVLALAPTAKDADYVAFRRNVERDIALGASPAAAIGVRLQAAMDVAESLQGLSSAPGTKVQRKRKP